MELNREWGRLQQRRKKPKETTGEASSTVWMVQRQEPTKNWMNQNNNNNNNRTKNSQFRWDKVCKVFWLLKIYTRRLKMATTVFWQPIADWSAGNHIEKCGAQTFDSSMFITLITAVVRLVIMNKLQTAFLFKNVNLRKPTTLPGSFPGR